MTSVTSDPNHFTSQLLVWYEHNARGFPWRQTDDPYRILICEVLLRRSRSTTVAKVADPFFERWPSPAELAEADVDDVIQVIRPLGLTGRAEQLVKMAEALRDRQEFPSTVDELVSLPGVGRYAAAATLGEPTVDGTSARVYRRYFGQLDAPEHKSVDDALWGLATTVLPAARRAARRVNWAVLDLAASTCLPTHPHCQDCPLAPGCRWARRQPHHHEGWGSAADFEPSG
jgi:A/G-specific adenine glycosylase